MEDSQSASRSRSATPVSLSPLPFYAVSPWVNFTLSGKSVTTNASSDASLDAEALHERAADYLDAHDATSVSALHADLSGLAPPVCPSEYERGGAILPDALRWLWRDSAPSPTRSTVSPSIA